MANFKVREVYYARLKRVYDNIEADIRIPKPGHFLFFHVCKHVMLVLLPLILKRYPLQAIPTNR